MSAADPQPPIQNAATNLPMYWSGRAQGWLQSDRGRRPRCVWLGNLLSDVRFWLWNRKKRA